MSKFSETSKKVEKALVDMEKFVEGYKHSGFIYRYGFIKSHENEGALVAMFDSETEQGLENKIAMLDKKFHEYTDSRVQREFDEVQNCWYATYVVCFPFDNEEISGSRDWQGFNPLF